MKRDIVRPNIQETALETVSGKAPKKAIPTADDLAMLKALMMEMGIEFPMQSTDKQKDDVAMALGKLVGKTWSGKYVHNILHEAIAPSQLFKAAMRIMAASLDDVPELMARARPMMLMVIGDVQPNSLVLASSKRCKNPTCRIRYFIPNVPNKVYCSPACKKAHRDAMQKARAELQGMKKK